MKSVQDLTEEQLAALHDVMDECKLSTRTRHCLLASIGYDIEPFLTREALRRMVEEGRIACLRNVGIKTLNEIKAAVGLPVIEKRRGITTLYRMRQLTQLGVLKITWSAKRPKRGVFEEVEVPKSKDKLAKWLNDRGVQ